MLSKEERSLFYVKLGESIKAARKKDGCKQEVLANRLGLTRISVVHIEQGKQKVQLHVLIEIADALKVTLNELLPSLDSIKTSELNAKMVRTMKKELEQFDAKEDAGDILTDFIKLSKSKS